MCGSFDLFHAGTVSFLESVRKRSDYLIVGIFSCEMLRHYLGPKFPLFSLEQRAMCVSACKYVDEILLNPPLVTSQVSFFEFLFQEFDTHPGLSDYNQLQSPFIIYD